MFGTIRKHQTWLWVLISAAVIVSFVVYFTPTGKRGGVGSSGNFGTINGHPIPRKQYMDAWLDTHIGLFLRSGQWPDRTDLKRNNISLENETRNRLVLLDRTKQMGIQVGVNSITEWITRNLGDSRQGGSAKSVYENLVRTVLPKYGVTEVDFLRFIRHQIAIGQLLEVAGIPGGLINPREAATLFREQNEKIEAEAAVFAAANYLAQATVDPAGMGQYYTNNRSLYRVPERVQLHYVKFASSNYLAEADAVLARETNLTQNIDRIYLNSPAGSFVDTNGQVLPPAAAKAQIKERAREQQALLAARKAAASFATNLESIKPLTAESLVNLAAAKGILPGVTEPFTQREGPAGLQVNSKFMELAFRLTNSTPGLTSSAMAVSPPIPTPDGVYLLSLKQRFPSEVPPLDAVRVDVMEAYKRDQATRLAREAGTTFARSLTNGLAQGKTFAAVCAGSGIKPVTIPKFSNATRTLPDLDPQLSLQQLQSVLGGKTAGQATDFVPTREGGFIAFVKARIPVTEAEVTAELPRFVATLRQSERMGAFNDWFRTQVEQSRIDTIKGNDGSTETAAQ